ncbi:orotidine-5'-phosphate decarboxylase [Caminibacter mediatlanticus TB-2]|uniref:Orotidine 5'-phosphate decarboxylase n=1 Tax=Caminibacter mediatlanticus TB-2 TaxID=391592 RepID=A0ABX5V6A5_9BACT|nr:orotidine-5'-phosphate decarboxylase [Caminibacter mediatlanticus]QCT93805.1 orotidine-5'-phosphate decarboxylase [Caminibacter mediatlanticus TB-2]
MKNGKNKMENKPKLCIAFDNPDKESNFKLAKELREYANDLWLKIGFRSYIRDGNDFIKNLKELGYNIFLDLKLYDIPNTMADASEEIAKLGVDMFNIHASAGKRAMREVMNRLQNLKKRPLVLAVTALTSFDNEEFKKIYGKNIEEKTQEFALDAYESGLDGVVCSVYESKKIKEVTNDKFITLTPGIRPFGEESGDQKRVADIKMAKSNLVDFIVVGRPIYKSKNPKEIVEKILKEI